MTARDEDFPCDTRTVRVSAEEFVRGGTLTYRVDLNNTADSAVLHARFAAEASWVRLIPAETALGPGERQPLSVLVDIPAARKAVHDGGAPVASVGLVYQRLGAEGAAPAANGAIYVRLPVALCPTCEKTLDPDLSDGISIPDICPFCFERLRACPTCGAANHWRARVCIADESHVLRTDPEWKTLGGSPAHAGTAPGKASALTRRWSTPSTAPARAEQTLAWSAPVAAYGLVASAAATPAGEAFLAAYDVRTGAPLWEPYPLPDPVYPERGGITIAGGRLVAATVDGAIVCLDVMRGTRLWETKVPGKVYGALVAAGDDGPILVGLADPEGGDALVQLDAETGEQLATTGLGGLPDTAPACADGVAFVHDSGPQISAIQLNTGELLWRVAAPAAFDAAPVVRGGRVFSGAEDGTVLCLDATSGAEVWRTRATSVPITGTLACDDTLLYVPAADGLHVISLATGKPVRRYSAHRPLRAAPVVIDGAVFVAGTDGEVQAAQAGRPLEKLYETGTVGAQFVAAPAVSDATLFLVATNGVLYALTLNG